MAADPAYFIETHVTVGITIPVRPDAMAWPGMPLTLDDRTPTALSLPGLAPGQLYRMIIRVEAESQ